LGRFSGQGELKMPELYILQNVHVKKPFQKKKRGSGVSFSSTFCFIAFSSDSQRWGFKNILKKTPTFCEKTVSESFYKKSAKNPKPMFSFDLFITFLGISR
jgi:hypothetical protein